MAARLTIMCMGCKRHHLYANHRSALKRMEILKRNMSSDTTPQPSSNEIKIGIPKRIERSPADILKALSSTVGKDYTAPHYKYHDDPYFVPYNSSRKAKYEISKKMGQQAAQYVKDQVPQYFARNDAEPNIPQFDPVIKENSHDFLLMNVLSGNVMEATNIYNALLTEGQEIPEDIILSFLELLCFYNSTQPEDEEINAKATWGQKKEKTFSAWKINSLAQKIFDQMENKTCRAYCAMIKGMAKFSFKDGAYELYQAAEEKGFKIDLETYNALIAVVAVKDGLKRWENVVDLMKKMVKDGVRPNLDTFNTALELVTGSHFKSSDNISLSIMAEMKRLNIKPSLASYFFILANVYRESGSMHTIIYSIMNEIEGNHFTLLHPKDAYFFVKAMDVCANNLNDAELAHRVDRLLNLGRNCDLLGRHFNSQAYYSRFFKILCTEDIDVLFEYYNKLVPNTYDPDRNVFKNILESIELNYAYNYVGQIWTDIASFKQDKSELIIETLLSVMTAPLENEQLQNQFSDIAKDILERILPKQTRAGRTIQPSGTMFANMIKIHLNSSRFEEAWNAFQAFKILEHRITGFIDENCITLFINECIVKEDRSKALELIRYGFETHPDKAESFSLDAFEHFDVGTTERRALESVMKKESFTAPPQ